MKIEEDNLRDMYGVGHRGDTFDDALCEYRRGVYAFTHAIDMKMMYSPGYTGDDCVAFGLHQRYGGSGLYSAEYGKTSLKSIKARSDKFGDNNMLKKARRIQYYDMHKNYDGSIRVTKFVECRDIIGVPISAYKRRDGTREISLPSWLFYKKTKNAHNEYNYIKPVWHTVEN